MAEGQKTLHEMLAELTAEPYTIQVKAEVAASDGRNLAERVAAEFNKAGGPKIQARAIDNR